MSFDQLAHNQTTTLANDINRIRWGIEDARKALNAVRRSYRTNPNLFPVDMKSLVLVENDLCSALANQHILFTETLNEDRLAKGRKAFNERVAKEFPSLQRETL